MVTVADHLQFVLVGWPEIGLVLKQVVAFGGAILAMSFVIDLVTESGPGFLRSARAGTSTSHRLARRYAGVSLRHIAVIGFLLLVTKLVYRIPRLDVTADVLWYAGFIIVGIIGAVLMWSSYHRKAPPTTPLP